MQTLLYLLAQAVATTASKSWAGSSNYYLHGLSESDQNSYIDSLQDVGAKVVRLWGEPSSSNPNVKELTEIFMQSRECHPRAQSRPARTRSPITKIP